MKFERLPTPSLSNKSYKFPLLLFVKSPTSYTIIL